MLFRDRFPTEVERALRDNVKYGYADTKIEYISFIEHGGKAEDKSQSSRPTPIEHGKKTR